MQTIHRIPACLGLFTCLAALMSTELSTYAQVVQLPSVRTFSSSGSVLVPDGGTAALGGSRYGSSSSARSGGGLTAGRALAGQSGGSSLSVSVQIIDLQALDEAILASAAGTASSATVDAQTSQAPGERASAWPPAAQTSQRVGADPGAYQRALGGAIRAPERLSSNDPALLESDLRYYMKRALTRPRRGVVCKLRGFTTV